MKKIKIVTLFLAVLMLVSSFSAVFVNAEELEQSLTLSLGAEPDSLDVSRTSDAYSEEVLVQIMEPLTRIEAVDEKTLKFTLEFPVPYFLSLSSSHLINAQREDIIEEFGTSYGTDADKMVCCGPFLIEDWIHNSEITFVKNENYWDADSVKLERMTFKIIEEDTALMGEFMNGNVDIIGGGSLEWIEMLEAEEKYDRVTKDIPRTSYFFFNQDAEPFNNVKVRQAFSLALDREEISNVLEQGLTVPAYGWCAPVIFCDDVNFREVAGDPLKDFAEEHEDPQALLIEGLKELGLSEDPADLTVTLMYADKTDIDFVEYFQQKFNEVLGVNVELDPDEWPVFQERNRQLDYEFGFKSWGAGQNDPSEYLNLWRTGNKTVPIAWSNEKYDNLVNSANESLNTEERVEKFVEAERILLVEDAAIAPFYYHTTDLFIQPEVKGLMFPNFAAPVYKYVTIEAVEE